jgi:hypothetical protein
MQVVKKIIALVMLIFSLVFAGCTTVDVINLSESNVRVQISLPDGTSTVRLVRPAGSTSTFSTHGGVVTISALPDEEYRNLLESIRAEISNRLMSEGAVLSPDDVSVLVQRLDDIDEAIARIKPHGSCTVSAPDFASVTAFLNWDQAAENISVSCSVAADESSPSINIK